MSYPSGIRPLKEEYESPKIETLSCCADAAQVSRIANRNIILFIRKVVICEPPQEVVLLNIHYL